MARGVVKWLNAERGYGIIDPEGPGPAVYFHVESAGEKSGRGDDGIRVVFDPLGPTKFTHLRLDHRPKESLGLALILGVEAQAGPSGSRKDLSAKDPVQRRAIFLTKSLGGVDELASILNLPESQLRSWATGATSPTSEIEQELLAIEHVTTKALTIWSSSVATQWLLSPNRALGGAQPIELAKQGRVFEVIEELQAIEQGAMG